MYRTDSEGGGHSGYGRPRHPHVAEVLRMLQLLGWVGLVYHTLKWGFRWSVSQKLFDTQIRRRFESYLNAHFRHAGLEAFASVDLLRDYMEDAVFATLVGLTAHRLERRCPLLELLINSKHSATDSARAAEHQGCERCQEVIGVAIEAWLKLRTSWTERLKETGDDRPYTTSYIRTTIYHCAVDLIRGTGRRLQHEVPLEDGEEDEEGNPISRQLAGLSDTAAEAIEIMALRRYWQWILEARQQEVFTEVETDMFDAWLTLHPDEPAEELAVSFSAWLSGHPKEDAAVAEAVDRTVNNVRVRKTAMKHKLEQWILTRLPEIQGEE